MATDRARHLARLALEAVGGDPRVTRFHYRDEENSVDLMECADRPTPGYTTVSTLTLHESQNLLEGRDIRVELAGVAPTDAVDFANVIATAAFFVMKDGWLCAPGVVFPGLLDEYELSTTLHHVVWTAPFPWEELGRVDAIGMDVHWLLAVPISDGERQFLEREGFDALEDLFARHELPYFDLSRPSAV